MKKTVLSCILLLGLLLSLSACSDSTDYRILEVAGYDNLSGAAHAADIELNNETYTRVLVNQQKKVEILGESYQCQYTNSQKGYLYKNDLDYYESKENGISVKFGINRDTGVISFYTWLSKNYTDGKEGPVLDREQCLAIATEHLNRYTNAADYTLSDARTRYLEIPEYEAIYDFAFVRMIDGIETCDKAYMGVTVYGDIISHRFYTLGEMKGVSAPSAEELTQIESGIDEKVQEIYESVSDRYVYSYEILERTLVKLSDGKRALEYRLSVHLGPPDASAYGFAEGVKLLVYLP